MTSGDCASRLNNPTGSKPVKYCGTDLLERFTLELYMVPSSDPQAKIPLSPSPKNPYCTGTEESFVCYNNEGSENGGIRLDNAFYYCGGQGRCKGRQAEDLNKSLKYLPGTSFTVYARLIEGSKQIGIPIQIDQIKLETSPRIVWGNLNSLGSPSSASIVLKDSYGATTKREQSIIAGRLTPIYIASGSWKDNVGKVDTNYTNFEYSIEENISSYSLDGAAGLEIFYVDSLGMERKATFPRRLPPSGIDTLYLKGGYDLNSEPISINIAGLVNNVETPSLKLTVYQPKLRFTDSTFTTFINPTNPSAYSGFFWWTKPDTFPPYVGNPLDVYVVAWDTLKGELCSHCNFILREASVTNNDTIKNPAVESNATRIENGKQKILIRGRETVEDTSYATWRVYGPSEGITFAVWDSLQFRATLIPAPEESYIYDRNGDGIGDSLIIKFSKSFRDDNKNIVAELLPVLLGVVWEKGGDTVYFHHPDYTNIKSLKDKDSVYILSKTPGFYEKNAAWWARFIPPGRDSILIIAEPNTAFSKGILTYGKGSLLSYTPYDDKGYCSSPTNCGPAAFRYPISNAFVLDRISPIVVKADYKMLDDNPNVCADIIGIGCKEGLIVYLSEPVFADSNATSYLVKNPFSYCFGYSQPESKCLPPGEIALRSDQAWNNIGLNGYEKWDWELPGADGTPNTANSTIYKPSKKYYPQGDQRDSTADIIYYADKNSRLPKATDWIKLRYDTDVFRDVEGNGFNPREIGVLISGTNVNRRELVKIAVINPDISPEDPRSIINGTFAGARDGDVYYPFWISDSAKAFGKDTLFKPGRVTEFLPLPSNDPKFINPDTIKAYYPSSVGTLFEVGHSIYLTADRVMKECTTNYTTKNRCFNKNGVPLTQENIAEGITMNASVYYHTNIGNYTAHRDRMVANCTDKIFHGENPLNPEYGNNCVGNEYNFYLAWDLKSNKNRYVGVGAYVAISKVHIILEYMNADKAIVTEKIYKNEAVQMFGVRRKKG